MLVPAVLLVLRRETGIPHPINRPSERATLTLTGTLRKPENNKLRMNRSNPSRIYFGFSLHSRPAPQCISRLAQRTILKPWRKKPWIRLG